MKNINNWVWVLVQGMTINRRIKRDGKKDRLKEKLGEDKYHFWIRPKCTCPKLDNDDRYPYGYYVVNMTCPLHGE